VISQAAEMATETKEGKMICERNRRKRRVGRKGENNFFPGGGPRKGVSERDGTEKVGKLGNLKIAPVRHKKRRGQVWSNGDAGTNGTGPIRKGGTQANKLHWIDLEEGEKLQKERKWGTR